MSAIAFIGTGIMGAAMAGHLLDAGHALFVYNRTREKAQPLIVKGAIWKGSPADCIKDAEFGITMVGSPQDVEETYFGEQGLFSAARPGSVLIDMTTSSPKLAKRIYEEAKTRGLSALDAPVSGGSAGANNAVLSIMAGGDEEAYLRALPLLCCMGKTISHIGGAGAGQHTKMANQIAVAGAIAGVSEAISYAKATGLNAEAMLKAISGGAAGSIQLTSNGPKMLHKDDTPGFYIKHFVKDMNIALEEAREAELMLPVLSTVAAMYGELCERGFENLGTQALIRYYKNADNG